MKRMNLRQNQKQRHFFEVITQFYRGQDLWAVLKELENEVGYTKEIHSSVLTATLGYVFRGEALPEGVVARIASERDHQIEACEAALVCEINNNENLQPIEKGECFERLHVLFASNVGNIFKFQLAMRAYFLPDNERNYADFMRRHFKYLQRPPYANIHEQHARRYAFNQHHDNALKELVSYFKRDQRLEGTSENPQLSEDDVQKFRALRLILKELLFNSETREQLFRCFSRIMYHDDVDANEDTKHANTHFLVLLLSLVQDLDIRPADQSKLICVLLHYLVRQVSDGDITTISLMLTVLNNQYHEPGHSWLNEVSQLMRIFRVVTPENFTIDNLVYLMVVNQADDKWGSPYGLTEESFPLTHQSEAIAYIAHQFYVNMDSQSSHDLDKRYEAAEIDRMKKWSKALVGVCSTRNTAGMLSLTGLIDFIANSEADFLTKTNVVATFLNEIEIVYGETSDRQMKAIYLNGINKIVAAYMLSMPQGAPSKLHKVVGLNEAFAHLDITPEGGGQHKSIHSLTEKTAIRCAEELSFWSNPDLNNQRDSNIIAATMSLRVMLWSFMSALVGREPLLLSNNVQHLESLLTGFINVGCFINRGNTWGFRNWNFLVAQALFYYFSMHQRDWKEDSNVFLNALIVLPILMNKESALNELSDNLIDVGDDETMEQLKIEGFQKLCTVLDALQSSEELEVRLPEAPYIDANLGADGFTEAYLGARRLDKEADISKVKLQLAAVFSFAVVTESLNRDPSVVYQRAWVGFFNNPNIALNAEGLAKIIFSAFHAADPVNYNSKDKVSKALEAHGSLDHLMRELGFDDAVIKSVHDAVNRPIVNEGAAAGRPASLVYAGL